MTDTPSIPKPNTESHWLTKTLAPFRKYNAWNSSLKELLGSNIPIMALTSSSHEFWDQAINQLGDNFPVFQGGWGIDLLATQALKAMNKEAFNKGFTGFTPNQTERYELGKALILYPLVTSFVLVSPLMRNAIMSHCTKKDNFVDLVKLDKNKPLKKTTETDEHKQGRLNKEHKIWRAFGTTMGLGVAASLAGFAFTHHGLKHDLPLPEWMKKTVNIPMLDVSFKGIKPSFAWKKTKHSLNAVLKLPKGDFRYIKDTALLLAWGLPSYAGMIYGSRDDLEKRENITRAIWFAFAFVLAPHLVEKPLHDWLSKKESTLFGSGENLVYLGQLGVSVGLYSAMPMLANLCLRKKRATKAGLYNETENQPAVTPLPTVKNPLASTLDSSSSAYRKPITFNSYAQMAQMGI
ncbi:MAG: hypothetical protein H2174_03705 [Vampirovibrio sp.]|nr:hypothetical protein [Vampirovibrio sp.]